MASASLQSKLPWRTKLSNTTLALLNVDLLRNVIFFFFVLRYVRKVYYSLRGYGIIGSVRNIYFAIRLWAFSLFLRAPGIRGKINKQVAASMTKVESKLVPTGSGVTKYLTLPEEGWSAEQVHIELDKLQGMDHTRWEDGRVSGAVYHGGEDLLKLQTEAIGKFCVANPIHPDVFPGVRKMEAEIVAMVKLSLSDK
jgi:sphinganine-1-phosphate aldolase